LDAIPLEEPQLAFILSWRVATTHFEDRDDKERRMADDGSKGLFELGGKRLVDLLLNSSPAPLTFGEALSGLAKPFDKPRPLTVGEALAGFAQPPGKPFGSLARLPLTAPFDFFAPQPSTPPSMSDALAAVLSSPPMPIMREGPRPSKPRERQRMVYFAFSFADIMRVNNVRQNGKLGVPEVNARRQFRDRSIWESRDINTDEGLKTLMRNCVKFSSTVCVLIGTSTWFSRWVRYEIARSVIDEKGLFAIHINSIKHLQRRAPDEFGMNPLNFVGLHRRQDGAYILVECVPAIDLATQLPVFKWQAYEDHTQAVPLPHYVAEFPIGQAYTLASFVPVYDMMQDGGYQNIGGWIERAAGAAGR
jgi:antiphage defense system Thoeris ThsB-like protein